MSKIGIFDEEKTKELVDGLREKSKDSSVIVVNSVDTIVKALQGNIIGVKIRSGMGRCSTSIPKECSGEFYKKSEETKAFVKDFMEDDRIFFFSKDIMKRTKKIVSRVKTYLERNALSKNDDSYMINKSQYEIVKKSFESAKEDYEGEMNYILHNYDRLYDEFKKSSKKAFEDLQVEDKMVAIQSVWEKFPTKEQIKRSFYIEMIVMPYPVLGDIEKAFSGEVLDDTKEGYTFTAIETFYGIVGSILNNLFQKVSSFQNKLSEGGTIPSRTKGAVNSAIIAAINDNSVVKNDKINKLIEIIRKALVNGYSINSGDEIEAISDSELEEVCEYVLSQAYGYATYLGIEEQIDISKCDYTEDDLLEIYKFAPALEKR